MGDRANVYIVDEKNESIGVQGVYLYTHWKGYEWPETLRDALVTAKPRWGDESYCTRIIVSNMFKGIHESETGGGISTFLTDNAYPILVVDQVRQTVSIADQGSEKLPTAWQRTMPFEEFALLDKATWATFGHGRDD